MKNKLLTRMFAMMLILVLAGISFAGCAKSEPAETTAADTETVATAESTDEDATMEEKQNYYFVFVPKVIHPWYEAVKQGIEAAIADYAAEGIEIKFEWDAPAEADVVVHTQKVQAAAAKQPDVIAVSVLDQASDGPIIDEVAATGVPVTTFDCDAPNSARTIFVGHSANKQDGIDLGEKMIELIGEEGEVAMLVGSLSAPNHIERCEGFREVMARYPGIKIVSEQADNDDLEKAISLTENIIKANPNLKGIFCCNASNPIGAARAVVDAGKEDQITIVGMDDMPEVIEFIQQGVISAVKVQNVFDIGYYSIKMMVDIADGKEVANEYPTGSYFVTPDNVQEYLDKAGN